MQDRLKHKFECDYLAREEVALLYSKFLKSLTTNHTIAIDAPWGTGKSKLIDFISEDLDESGDLYIRYNAWEHDYTNEAFLSFMSSFFFTVKEKKYIEHDLQNLKSIAFKASKFIVPSLIKGGASLFFGGKAVEEMGEGVKEIIKGFTDVPEQIANDTFEALNESKQSRDDFTSELKKTVSKILKKYNKNKLIIIIDELDRCKPTFAIELLENIKHLFQIEEIVFLIAVDKKQLSESLKVVYGSNFDSMTYLQRFFDLSLHLNTRNLNAYFEYKIKKVFKLEYGDYDLDKILEYSVSNFDLTIRDFERLLSETYFLIKINNEMRKSLNQFDIIFIILILKYKANDIYNIIIDNNQLSKDEILGKIDRKHDSHKYRSFLSTHSKKIFDESRPNHYLSSTTNQYIRLIEQTL